MAKRNDRRIEPTFDGPAKGKAARGLSVSEDDRVVPTQRAQEASQEGGRQPLARQERFGRHAQRPSRPIRQAVLLVLRAGDLGRHRRCRHRRLLRRQDAGGHDMVDPRPLAQHQDRLGGRQAARQSRHDRRRGGRAARDVALYPAGGDGDRGPPLLFAFRHRPDRPGPRDGDEPDAWPLHAGRLDADAAAGEEPVPEARPDGRAQGAGSAARAVAGAEAHEGPDPRNVSQPGLFRLGRLWRRGGVAALFRQNPRATFRCRRPLCWRACSRRRPGFRRRAIRRPPRSARSWCSPRCARRR